MITYILIKFFQHFKLCFVAIMIATLISVPLGILLAKTKYTKLSNIVLRIVAIIQTIPGLAFIALLVAVLVAFKNVFSLPTTGFFPSIIVLSLYALFPILSNTYTGIKHISDKTIDVALSLGMTSKQILFSVQLPLALPFIITGIRISFIWIIGMATLTSLVGSGGLGDLIMQGLRSMRVDLILSGTVPAAVFAIFFDIILSNLKNYLEPHRKKI